MIHSRRFLPPPPAPPAPLAAHLPLAALLGAALHPCALPLAALLLACGGDSSVVFPEQPGGAEMPSTPGEEGSGQEKPPLYLLTTTVSTEDSDQGYLVPFGSLDAGSFDLGQAVEVADSTIAGKLGDSFFYVGSSADPTITRWDIQDDDSFTPGPTLSLANFGLTRASVGNELFHSAQKAYIPDDANRQLVVWNPEAMEIIGTIPLGTEAEGPLQPSMSVTVRPDRVVVVVSWQGDFEGDWSEFGDHVRVISIDPVDDSIVDVVEDSRCNYLFWGSTSSDGTAYFSPLSYYTPIRSMLGGERGADSCGLRIVPPGAAFDAGYEVDLSSVVGGRPAGNLFLVDDDVAFLRVWHSELVTSVSADKSNWEDVINEAGFLWWRWPLGAAQATQIPDQEPGASETTALYTVGDRKFLPRVAADYSSTTLDELDPSGALRPTLSGPGNIWGLLRMR